MNDLIRHVLMRVALLTLSPMLVCLACEAQTVKPRAPKPVDTIRQKIESKDPQQIKEAVETIWEQLHSTNPQDVKNVANGISAAVLRESVCHRCYECLGRSDGGYRALHKSRGWHP
jgi:hypothetical protein